MTYWMGRTYADLAALCGYRGANERDYDWDTDTQPDFIQYEDLSVKLGECLRARANLVSHYRTDCGFDALAWDAYLAQSIEAYGRSLFLDPMPFEFEIWQDQLDDALATIRTLITASQDDPEVQALRRAAQVAWTSGPPA